MRNVTFTSGELSLAGDLYTPAGFDERGHYPGVIVQGSLSSVKEQMAGTYARKLAEQGFVALTFDYAHYGQSEGTPRQLENPAEKLADLRAAVTYLLELPHVDAVGMLGVCTSASNAVELAARDGRVKALATAAGFLVTLDMFVATYGRDGITERREQARAAKLTYEATGGSTLITVYSETDPDAANYNPTPGAYDYYLNPERGGVPQYANKLDVQSWTDWLSFDALAHAGSVTTPTIVVHSDGCAAPANAKALHDAVQGEKELVWGDGIHWDYYDSDAQVDFAVENISRFLRDHVTA